MYTHDLRLVFLRAMTMALLLPGMVHAQCYPRNTGVQVENPPRPKIVEGFIEAMRTSGEGGRQAAVRAYLKSVLETADWRSKSNLRRWLNDSFAVFDPAPYEGLLKELSCYRLLDMAELRKYRDLQLDVFGTALNDGQAFLPRGTVIGCNQAVIGTAEYGLEELVEDVARFYARNWTEESADLADREGKGVSRHAAFVCQDFKTKWSYEAFKLDLKLHAGGKDYDEANRLAGKRLAETPAEELRGNMMKLRGFDGVLWRIASYACAVNVFTGEQRRACRDVMKAYVQQRWLMEDLEKAEESVVWPKGFAALGWCYIDHVPFGDYVVPPRDFLSPAHMRILNHSREELRRRREEGHKAKNLGGVTR